MLLNAAGQARPGQAQQLAAAQQQQGGGAAAAQTVWSKFEKGEKIGEGTYGWVYHARSKDNGNRYAIKQFKSGRVGARAIMHAHPFFAWAATAATGTTSA
jgi:serine/threonine protein kinase